MPASTLILLRAAERRFQVYLLRRSRKSGFMPGNYVFPGGTVEPSDGNVNFWKDHVDMGIEQIRSRFCRNVTGFSIEETVAHGIAAVRETFEEACLLFARNTLGRGEPGLEGLLKQNAGGTLPAGWLGDLVCSGEWTVNLSALARWSHWITPEIRARRYDTRFFAAFMPGGQECRPDNRETTHGIWASPEQALKGNLERKIPLSPPTLATLHELLQYTEFSSLRKELETRSWGEVRIPRLVPVDRGALLLLPWDPAYRDRKVKIDRIRKRPAPMGRPFSRIWYDGEIWYPLSP